MPEIDRSNERARLILMMRVVREYGVLSNLAFAVGLLAWGLGAAMAGGDTSWVAFCLGMCLASFAGAYSFSRLRVPSQ